MKYLFMVNNNISQNKKANNLILPLFIILAPYSFFGEFYSVGMGISLLYGLFSVFVLKTPLVIPKTLLRFLIFILFIYLINLIRNGEISLTILNSVIGSVITVFLVSVFIKNFNFIFFYKWYKLFSIIASIVIIYHSIRLFIFDIPAVPIAILPVSEADSTYWGSFLGKRPSGFFTEPQAFCSYVIPFFIFSLYKKEYMSVLLVLVAILLSTSTLGLAIAILVILFFLLQNKDISVIKRFFLVLLIFFSYFLINSYGLLDFSVNKIQKTEISNNIRLTRGFNIYGSMDIQNMILGVSQNLEDFVLKNVNEGWVANYQNNDMERLLGYTTSYSGLLLQYGLFSLILYLYFLFSSSKNAKQEEKTLMVVIFILGFAQTIIFNAWFVFYISVFLGIMYERKKLKALKISIKKIN